MADDFTDEQFRLDFPEFADPTKYTEAMVAFWAGVADKQMNTVRWGDLLLYGTELFVAHNLALAVVDLAASQAPFGVPGQGNVLASSQGAGSVNVSADTTTVSEPDGGYYNLTTYGTRFLRMARIAGIGGAQL